MTIYTEHELRAMASKMRTQINDVGLPDRLWRKLNEFTDLIDGTADGKVSQEALQAAVDQINRDLEHDAGRRKRMADIGLLVDQAIEEDDPGAWRDAMLRWLPLLPEDYLRVLMDSFGAMVDDAEVQQAIALVEMPAISETVN